MAETLTPSGTTAMAGLAVALSAYDMSSTGMAISGNVKTALSRSLTAASLKSIGTNAMAGLRAGINAGRSGVVSAMQSAARAAVNAAKKELTIASPSKVFRDEVGSMTMKGFGEGVLQEAYLGTTLMNNHMSGDFPVLKPGANAISWSGTVTKVIIQPRWRFL